MKDLTILNKKMICKIRVKQVMLVSEISDTKWHHNYYDYMMTHTGIRISISVCNKLRKELTNDRIKSW